MMDAEITKYEVYLKNDGESYDPLRNGRKVKKVDIVALCAKFKEENAIAEEFSGTVEEHAKWLRRNGYTGHGWKDIIESYV